VALAPMTMTMTNDDAMKGVAFKEVVTPSARRIARKDGCGMFIL